MAHYKRGKCRWHGKGGHFNKRRKPRGNGFPTAADFWRYGWLCSWPKWHDIVFHTRPQRARSKALTRKILKGADPEGISFNPPKKPHIYYW